MGDDVPLDLGGDGNDALSLGEVFLFAASFGDDILDDGRDVDDAFNLGEGAVTLGDELGLSDKVGDNCPVTLFNCILFLEADDDGLVVVDDLILGVAFFLDATTCLKLLSLVV